MARPANSVRAFVFTWNNYPVDCDDILSDFYHKNRCRYMVYGRELGMEGTPHLQGFVQLPAGQQWRHSRIRKSLPGCHIEVAQSPVDAARYCKKGQECWSDFRHSEKAVGDGAEIVEFGELSLPGAGAALEKSRWAQILDSSRQGNFDWIAENHPDAYLRYYSTLRKIHLDNLAPLGQERTCLWIYGGTGTGKSRLITDTFKDEVVYRKNPNKWWDRYTDQPIVVLEDFDQNQACLGYYLKIWADRYPFLGEVKGAGVYPNYKCFIVTSNYHPSEIWTQKQMLEPILRRFRIVEKTMKNSYPPDLFNSKLTDYFKFNCP